MMIWVTRVVCSIEVVGVWLIDVSALLLSVLICDNPDWCFLAMAAPRNHSSDRNMGGARASPT